MARLRGMGLAVVWLLALTGPAWAQGGTLRVGLPIVSPTLDPATALEGPLSVIARQMFDTLVQYREITSDIEPGLASQWSVSRQICSARVPARSETRRTSPTISGSPKNGGWPMRALASAW